MNNGKVQICLSYIHNYLNGDLELFVFLFELFSLLKTSRYAEENLIRNVEDFNVITTRSIVCDYQSKISNLYKKMYNCTWKENFLVQLVAHGYKSSE